jgi:hypothetical protein
MLGVGFFSLTEASFLPAIPGGLSSSGGAVKDITLRVKARFSCNLHGYAVRGRWVAGPAGIQYRPPRFSRGAIGLASFTFIARPS